MINAELKRSTATVLQGKQKSLEKKYGTTAFMYTEYPHKRFWSKDNNPHTLSLNESLLYVHIPYCQQLCYFCTCHMSITNDYSKITHYLEYLYKEIKLIPLLEPNIKEIHLGGGSPTDLKEQDFAELTRRLGTLTNIDTLDEFSIEIDPRRVGQKMMHFYADQGISRISFGVQDFDPDVQKAVNRLQPAYLIEDLLTKDIRSRFKNGVNFDIICGLPKQTITTMAMTCREIIRLAPDRICLNYLHYSPEMAKHQKLMGELPDFAKRKELFGIALEILTSGGYVRTGYDHFALPTDANAKATLNGKAGWNSLGTTPGRVKDVIGIGVSSISFIENRYFQNYYELKDYEKSLDEGKFPIYRGHQLNEDEKLRLEIIQNLRSFFVADIKHEHYFKHELETLKEFQSDGLVVISGTRVVIVEPEYANLVCRVFDKFYKGESLTPDLGERDVERNAVQAIS